MLLIVVLLYNKTSKLVNKKKEVVDKDEAERFVNYLLKLEAQEVETVLQKRKEVLRYKLSNDELSGRFQAHDNRGIIKNVNENSETTFVPVKKKAQKRASVNPKLSKMILWYLGTAAFWLIFGTTIGEYLGIKFVSPDVDEVSWLSFGRLRPVHTNAVFWGWCSLAMLGLGNYVVPTVSNTELASYKKGWYGLALINAAVVIGSICLMAGINNGGGEYREYTWPVMGLFGLGLILSLSNFWKTVAARKTKEIYISNWYIISAIIFTLTIAFVAYWPSWQNGLGETIIQGYFMHQGVGMWFMLFNLGLIYYFLPQQLNKPIYSYSLGVIAFWSQIFFYTVIGTHHFVFSSIPWWLQTVAIVGSAGMLIPVCAGTTNFFMSFKGAWSKVKNSYTLPFYLVGIVFYFTGSLQGTAEAFRYTNQLWHFTDFTVAHSHITMYGIITFMLWASIYAVVPRLTGKEPSQIWVGAHFWMALIGLLFYTIPLMIGGTLKGMMWMDGKPFIDSVEMMVPYWVWRAIGGTMMWLSHLIFGYNFYKMIAGKVSVDVKELTIQRVKQIQMKPAEVLY
jgi:cytochrome c oxidase cbb3-type subunit 1